MRTKSKAYINHSAAALAAAIAGVSFTTVARARPPIPPPRSRAQIEPGDAYEDGAGGYWQLISSPNTYPTFGILDFGAGSLGIPQGQQVTAVDPNLTLTLYYDSYSKNTTTPVTLTFYIATDTNSAEVQSGATILSWEANGTEGPGLNMPGQTGSFAAGTSLYELGTETYSPTGTSGTALNYGFTLNSTEQEYIQGQINTGNTIRIVATTSAGSSDYEANFYGYAANPSTYDPNLTVNVFTQTVASNGSKLYLGPTGTAKMGTVSVGTMCNIDGTSTLCVLQSAPESTATVTLNNGGTGTLTYAASDNGADATFTSPGPNPIPAGQTAQATVGYNLADTTGEAGNTLSGATATFTNNSNYATDTQPVTVTLADALVLQERYVDSASGTSTPNVGKVLVGTTGTLANIPITTTNPVNITDYTDDALTTLTLMANTTSTPYPIYDHFTGNTVGTISATNGTAVMFGGPNQVGTQIGYVTGDVAVAISGVYDNDVPVVEGNSTQTYNPQFSEFGQTDITGDGLQGENDDMGVYLQWQGYQAAAVTGNGTPGSPLTVAPNSTSLATLSNAASNDNLYTASNETTYNNGLRADAWVTGVSAFNQTWGSGGWSQSSFAAVDAVEVNGVWTAESGTVVPGGGTASSNIGFTTNSQMINGTYGSSITVDLENELDIQGAAVINVAPVTINVQATVSSNPSIQSGSYTLNGGTLSATDTDLTGSFTQYSGQSTFGNITGTGSVTISGGSLTLATNGGGSAVSSLSISGGGSLNISNNHIIISDPGGSIDSTIRAYLAAGYNGGGWNGTSATSGVIVTSAPITIGAGTYSIGYADGDDNVVSGLLSGEFEVAYTLAGDANLDGKVDSADFGILADNYGASGAVWDQGDFNYDGKVDSADFGILAVNYGQSAGSNADVVTAADWSALDAFAAANGITLSAVPEPASVGILALSGLAILSRRTRRRICSG